MTKEYMMIVCTPLSYSPKPPKEQEDCKVELCPECKDKIWVSKRKREMRKKNPKNVKVWCGLCIVKYFKKNNIPLPEQPIDLLDFQ